MSERVTLHNQLIETPEILIKSGRFSEVMKLTQANRKAYEEASAEKQFYDLVLLFRAAIFGSARFDRGSKDFKFVTELARGLVEARGIDIVTGGGMGIMKAANRGLNCAKGLARKNGEKCKARNIGVRVNLPLEERGNPHLHINTLHREFHTRLKAFESQIKGAYIAPGGDGSLLELAYFLQLKQVGHVEKDFPIIVHPFWNEILDATYRTFYHNRIQEGETPTISEKDLNLVVVSENIPDIVDAFTARYDFWRKNFRDKVRFVTSEN
ncbi:MAG: LOG family protein [Candidatus Gracilibacteria bacterium]|nr:LOG family protein [Candidatus Gracilibacteria bacterium]MDD5179292.1 LOG family protein [Candidatus Gracilibacteria bacterium]